MAGPVIQKEKVFTSLVPPKEKPSKKSGLMPDPYVERGPTLYINRVDVPGLSGKELGAEFTATIKCKVVGSNLSERDGGVKHRSFDLEVTAISMDSQR